MRNERVHSRRVDPYRAGFAETARMSAPVVRAAGVRTDIPPRRPYNDGASLPRQDRNATQGGASPRPCRPFPSRHSPRAGVGGRTRAQTDASAFEGGLEPLRRDFERYDVRNLEAAAARIERQAQGREHYFVLSSQAAPRAGGGIRRGF